MTRRGFLKGLAGIVLSGLFAAAYAFFVEPALRLRVRTWRVARSDWGSAPLKIAILSDLHAGEPFVSRRRLRRIVRRTNALGADLIVILGDLAAGHPYLTAKVPVADTARILGGLQAPLGVFSILGNHDWWDDRAAQRRGSGPVQAGVALAANGIPVLENDVRRIGPIGRHVWLAGLGDQLALIYGPGPMRGVDDLPGTMARIPDDGAPVILMAHEPDIFPNVPDRVALTLSGHTHGGQVRLFGWSPVVPSIHGNRYAYGHIREGRRDLVVSGGIGCSILPIRFGVVPEITVVEVGA